jgi:hypothetical protein
MKRNDKRLLDTFSDSSMTIDANFKNNLRAQIVKRSGKKSFARWRRLVLVPAFALIAFVLLFAGLQNPEKGGSPFKPERVSAAELIERSEDAKRNSQQNKYTFVHYSTESLIGPKITTCGYSTLMAVNADGSFPKKMRSESYIYVAPDNGVEALYNRAYMDGRLTFSDAVYDESKKVAVGASLLSQPTSINDILHSDKFSFPGRVFVNEQGREISQDAALEPRNYKGRTVYNLFAKSTEAFEAAECTGVVVQIVVDAQSYQVLENNLYAEAVGSENLIHGATNYVQREALDSDSALEIMRKAGFEKEKARPRLNG